MSRHNKKRILFFAWGFSIHALRRIEIFSKDPAYKVGVISNYNYNFDGADNFCLSNVVNFVEIFGKKISFLAKIVSCFLYIILKPFRVSISLSECHQMAQDIFLVKKYFKIFNPDVIFLQTLLYPNYLSFLLSPSVPRIITFWNGDVTWWAKWTGVERAFKKQIVYYGVKQAVAITVNSEEAYKACLSYGVSDSKVSLIRYPGVDVSKFKPSHNQVEIRKRLGISHGKVVLCPRGIGGYLNSDIIIDAARIIAKKFPDTLFLFLAAGDDEVWNQYSTAAKNFGFESNLARVAKVSWEEMPDYYCASDLMVSISSNDSLPNCMIEAMACGVPVLMGDIPQIREWVVDGVNGLLTPPRNSELLATKIERCLFGDQTEIKLFIERSKDLVNDELGSVVASSRIKKFISDVIATHSS